MTARHTVVCTAILTWAAGMLFLGACRSVPVSPVVGHGLDAGRPVSMSGIDPGFRTLPEEAFPGPREWRFPPGTPSGTLLDRRFLSQALDAEVAYFAYLPPGYADAPEQRYPVVYLLHGLGGERTKWLELGTLQHARWLMIAGEIQPMIFVLPEGRDSYWVNHYQGPHWGDYVAHDLVADVDAHFRTVATPRGRAIGGLSAGGTGAIQIAFNYPDSFGVAGAHSPTVRTFDEAFPFFGGAEYFASIDPLTLAREGRLPAGLTLRIDAGDVDDWYERTAKLSDALNARGFDHEFATASGWHDDRYWLHEMEHYLRFYSAALTPQKQATAMRGLAS